MKTIDEVIKNKEYGLHYGNRMLLPFTGTILKMVIERDIILDFSPRSKDVTIIEKSEYLEIYLHNYGLISEAVNKYEQIKMIVVEHGKSIFDFNNHKKIAIRLEEKHKLLIEELDQDILFIE